MTPAITDKEIKALCDGFQKPTNKNFIQETVNEQRTVFGWFAGTSVVLALFPWLALSEAIVAAGMAERLQKKASELPNAGTDGSSNKPNEGSAAAVGDKSIKPSLPAPGGGAARAVSSREDSPASLSSEK